MEFPHLISAIFSLVFWSSFEFILQKLSKQTDKSIYF